jgi:hypothetical protein
VSNLLEAISPRLVAIVNPADAIAVTAREEAVGKELAAALESERQLGTPERIRLIRRGFRDPLPIE